MWIADAARCREIDREAIEEYGLTTETLVERAGEAVFRRLNDRFQEPMRITVVGGKGNNGADGYVAARLAAEHGYEVKILVAANYEDLNPVARASLDRARPLCPSVSFLHDAGFALELEAIDDGDAVIDAVMGTGFTGELDWQLKPVLKAINDSGIWVLSVDIPSGLNSDTGEADETGVEADCTVTFGLPKLAFFDGDGPKHVGAWTVSDPGFPRELLDRETGAFFVDEDWLRPQLSTRTSYSHKGDHGSVLVVAGSEGMPGAAVLAARGALRGGAGLVTVAAPPSVCQVLANHLPEVILLPLGGSGEPAAETIRSRGREYTVGVFGPGMGTRDEAESLLASIWSWWDLPAVIDADAINLVARGLELPKGPRILTPHPGEMGRLLGKPAQSINANRFESARHAANQYGGTVVLKGQYSLIAEAESPVAVNSTGNAGMATGGMGDVLSGVIASLVGQGISPLLASVAGVYLHGAAADLCAATIGGIGFTASEVADALPQARAKLSTWPESSPSSR